jgi:hypothetical protein
LLFDHLVGTCSREPGWCWIVGRPLGIGDGDRRAE